MCSKPSTGCSVYGVRCVCTSHWTMSRPPSRTQLVERTVTPEQTLHEAVGFSPPGQRFWSLPCVGTLACGQCLAHNREGGRWSWGDPGKFTKQAITCFSQCHWKNIDTFLYIYIFYKWTLNKCDIPPVRWRYVHELLVGHVLVTCLSPG